MLGAYFDDSGTHGGDIVLVAGFFGYVNQWNHFSNLWAKKLADPCPGKLPLSEFHMAECQASQGEFLGWKRTETDFLVHELATIILQCGIYGFGGAVARKEYEKLVTGEWRRAHGDAETMCITNCFVTLTDLAKRRTPDPHVAILFDDRPQKRRDVQKIFDVYRGTTDGGPSMTNNPEIVSVGFASSKKILPLQAADMLAWEFYQDASDALAGRRESEGPRRKQLMRLVAGGRVTLGYCSPESVAKMLRHPTDPQLLATIANHLDFK